MAQSLVRKINIFRGSSAVEQLTVNQLVAGSNPVPGAMLLMLIQQDPVMGLLL